METAPLRPSCTPCFSVWRTCRFVRTSPSPARSTNGEKCKPSAALTKRSKGFFDVCRAQGLTGQQGVMIPASNVRNLVLRADVIEAGAQGQFHIYPVRTIDQGIELLTGVRAGTEDEEGTVNGLVSRRLRELATGLKHLR